MQNSNKTIWIFNSRYIYLGIKYKAFESLTWPAFYSYTKNVENVFFLGKTVF